MPRRPRVFVAGASYHVYCRVARGERVFADPREAAALVGVIREVVREHGLSVLAWCVMASHYHLEERLAALEAGPRPTKDQQGEKVMPVPLGRLGQPRKTICRR